MIVEFEGLFVDGYINWECLESPTGFCRYSETKDPAHDHCLHCGKPYERK